MEPPSPKRQKLDNIASESEPTTEDELTQPVVHASVRQQLRDLLSEASAQCCGTPLPTEISDLIIHECLFSDFSEIPDNLFDLEECQVRGGFAEYLGNDHKEVMFSDPLRRHQLSAIMDLPGKPLEGWGTEIEDIIDNGDMGACWIQVGFPVGWKDSGELLEFDVWFCCEVHHFEATFVFEKGSTEVLLRSEPKEFCKAVRHPERAKELAVLCGSLFWSLDV